MWFICVSSLSLLGSLSQLRAQNLSKEPLVFEMPCRILSLAPLNLPLKKSFGEFLYQKEYLCCIIQID